MAISIAPPLTLAAYLAYYEERVYAGGQELESREFSRLGLMARELLGGRLERAKG